MMKYLITIIIILVLLSCNGKSAYEARGSTTEEAISREVVFTDIIPENISDSTKIDKIKEIIRSTDLDTSLVLVEVIDSIEIAPAKHYLAKYRNDTLVKISVFQGVPHFTIESTYYFLMNELISVEEFCRAGRAAAMCNSEAVRFNLYFYNGKVIGEESWDSDSKNVKYGCPSCALEREKFSSLDLGETPDYEQEVLEEIKTLRARFENTASKG